MSAALTYLSDADRVRVAKFVTFALDQLWYSSPDARPDQQHDPDEYLGCCPVCCAPCHALAELLTEDTLDDWVRGWKDNTRNTWWDAVNDQVDRKWLFRAWSQLDKKNCHDQEFDTDLFEDEEEEPWPLRPSRVSEWVNPGWYLALCMCSTGLTSMPFQDEALRDEWAQNHHKMFPEHDMELIHGGEPMVTKLLRERREWVAEQQQAAQ